MMRSPVGAGGATKAAQCPLSAFETSSTDHTGDLATGSSPRPAAGWFKHGSVRDPLRWRATPLWSGSSRSPSHTTIAEIGGAVGCAGTIWLGLPADAVASARDHTCTRIVTTI